MEKPGARAASSRSVCEACLYPPWWVQSRLRRSLFFVSCGSDGVAVLRVAVTGGHDWDDFVVPKAVVVEVIGEEVGVAGVVVAGNDCQLRVFNDHMVAAGVVDERSHVAVMVQDIEGVLV